MTCAYFNLPMHNNLMTNFSISNQYCVINSNTDVTTNASKNSSKSIWMVSSRNRRSNWKLKPNQHLIETNCKIPHQPAQSSFHLAFWQPSFHLALFLKCSLREPIKKKLYTKSRIHNTYHHTNTCYQSLQHSMS